MEYLITFLTVIALTWITEHSTDKGPDKWIKKFIILVILCIPSLLFALRDIRVGTDTAAYMNRFAAACGKTFDDYVFSEINYAINESLETGFMIFIWIVSKFTNSFAVFEFVLCFLTFCFFFEGAKYFSKKEEYSLTLMVAIYLFVYFCPFMNYQRQGLAVSILWYSLRYIDQRKFKSFLVCLFFAASIHISSLLFAAFYFVISFSEKLKSWQIIVIISMSFLLICAGPQTIFLLLCFLSKIGIRASTILKYSRRFYDATGYNIHISELIMALPQFILFTVFYKKISLNDNHTKGYYCICVFHVILTVIGSVDANFNRISILTGICELILFAALYKSLRSRAMKFLFCTGMSIYLVLYWIVFTVNNFYHFENPLYPYLISAI